MKTALTGYIISMARILYVHVIGTIALLPRRDYFAMIIEIASMARILNVHVIGVITRSPKYFACFVGVSSSSGIAYSIYIYMFFWFFRPRNSKKYCCFVASSYPVPYPFYFPFFYIFQR